MVPAGLQGNADILFGNLHELYTFHSETFLKDLENCISTTELVALCFVQRVSEASPAKNFTNFIYLTARRLLPTVLVLLSEHSPVGATAGDARRHSLVPAGVPEETGSQASVGGVLT